MKNLLLLSCVLLKASLSFSQDFITQWNLTTPGSGATQLTFGVATSGTVNYTWTTVPAASSGSGSFNGTMATIIGLPAGATIRVSIQPTNFQRIIIDGGFDAGRLVEILQWGSTNWTSMEYAFFGCVNLQISAIDTPNLLGVQSMSHMFAQCTNLNSPNNINLWNTSSVTNMSGLFDHANAFNQDIGLWSTDAVTNMDFMFSMAGAFNQPIGNWNTANVTTMSYMFAGSQFNQNIGEWNTGAVTNMESMFGAAQSFNQNISSWNTSNLTNMSGMFINAHMFNQPIGSWNTSSVTDMSYLFCFAYAFNQPLDTWNTSEVTNMNATFRGANLFNQDITTWNTSAVTNMGEMFYNANLI